MLFEDVVSIKQHNIKKILTAIRFNDHLTKRNISNQTGLSLATITNLCGELTLKGIISEGTPYKESRVGRTPSLMRFHYDRFYVLALDFQYSNTVGIAIMNLRNEICLSDSLCISATNSIEEIIAYVKERANQLIDQMGVRNCIIGVGASIPAVHDSNDGLIKCSALPRYQNTPMKKLLSEAFDCDAYVDNCANIRAISAYAQHAEPCIVCLDVSQGVGCGLMIDGDVLRGKNGYATEIAHIPLGDPTRKCPTCGSYGCVETDLNIEYIINQFEEIAPSYPLTERWKICLGLIEKKAEKVEGLFKYLGKLLGQVASILINLFDPYSFYITGFITDIFQYLEPYFWKEVQGRCQESLSRNLPIKVCPYDWSDVYIGISDTLYHRWLP